MADEAKTGNVSEEVGGYVRGPAGEGGYGEVFEGRPQNGRGKAVALKRIWLPEQGKYPAGAAESSIHVLDALADFEDNGYFGLVMPLIEHGDLRVYLKKNPSPWPLKDALHLARGIAKGLAAIHARSIFQLDLKPRNVLMDVKDGEWIPKIADFGLARSSQSIGDLAGE